jgi:hypothetical protein
VSKLLDGVAVPRVEMSRVFLPRAVARLLVSPELQQGRWRPIRHAFDGCHSTYDDRAEFESKDYID